MTEQPLNALTVDVEDYFQVSAFEKHVSRDHWDHWESRVEGNTHRILQVLDERGVKATFFVLGWTAQRYPQLVRDIAAGGHEIASHGYWHRLIYEQSPQEFREDLRRSRQSLEDAVGQPVTAYRAPSFSITRQSLWALEVLVEEGFRVDSSIFPIHHDRYGIPDAEARLHCRSTPAGSLWEFPPAVFTWGRLRLPVGGGGYFRLWPLWWTLYGLRRINRLQQQPFIFYVHPWEVDPAQPRVVTHWGLSRFRHYVNLATTEPKLRTLLGSFRFGRLCDVVEVANGAGKRAVVEHGENAKIASSVLSGEGDPDDGRNPGRSRSDTTCPHPDPFPSCRNRQAGEGDLVPMISVIVPVRNEASFIERTVSNLLGQTYAGGQFEVLVVDGQSTDATPEIVARLAGHHGNLRLLSNPRKWSSAARNIAIDHARGDVVVVVDGHCEIDDDQYLTRLATAFQQSGADCIGRPQPLDVRGASRLQRAIALARSSPLGHHPDSYIYSQEEQFVPAKSVAVAYRRSVFDTVGGFDERFDACEDVEMNHRIDRAGLRCYFTPKVAVRYVPRGTLGGLVRQMVRYGRGRVRLARKHPDTFAWKTFLPALFVLGCLAGPLLAVLSSWLGAAYLAGLGIYVSVVLAVSVMIALRQRDLRLAAILPPVFTAIHVGSGLGSLLELCRWR